MRHGTRGMRLAACSTRQATSSPGIAGVESYKICREQRQKQQHQLETAEQQKL